MSASAISVRSSSIRGAGALAAAALFAAALLLSLAPRALAADEQAEDTRIPGRYIVVFEDSVDRPGALALEQTEEQDGELGFVYRTALKGYSAQLTKSAVAELREDPRVRYVAPDRKLEIAAQTVPTGIQRSLATSNPVADIDETDDARVNVDVAVLDTGVYSHTDLNVFKLRNCVPAGEQVWEESTGCVEKGGADVHGHGTHVAGTIGAIDNNLGVVGVAPGARIWSVRVMEKKGEGPESWLVAGVDWITAQASEIEVANVSLGCYCYMPALDKAIAASVDAGVVYAVAAGNDSFDVSSQSPANHPDVITVSALADSDGQPGFKGPPGCKFEQDDTLASFSNYGTGVELAAPGVCINSTKRGGGYEELSGTSMASPHVAGAAALLASKANPASQADVEAIRSSLVKNGSQEWTDDSGDGVQEPLLDIGWIYTGKAVASSKSKATLYGRINPNGYSTSYYFEYGTSTAYGTKAPVSAKNIGEGTEYVQVNEVVEGLEEKVSYHYRLVATAPGKEPIVGADQIFSTSPPQVVAASASAAIHNATLDATINPAGSATQYYFEYGPTVSYGSKAPTGLSELAAGLTNQEVSADLKNLDGATTYHFRVVATNTAGTTFGKDTTFTTQPPKWKLEKLATVGETNTPIEDVTCVSTSWCVAVGARRDVSEPVLLPLAEIRDGSSWSISSTPSPTEFASWGTLRGVSCTSTSFCVAVGNYIDTAGMTKAVSMKWDGSSWSLLTTPLPAEATRGELASVSCTSSSACVAVGHYRLSGTPDKPLAMRWDGSSWTVQSVPLPASATEAFLRSVSCSGSSFCAAVGRADQFNGIEGLTVHWNGSEWTHQPGADPAESDQWDFEDVSCTATNACALVGWRNPVGPTGMQFLAETWNGSEWKAISSPPVQPREISCSSASSCLVLGSSKNAFAWDGTSWTTEELPSEPFPAEKEWGGSEFVGLSCLPTSKCVAVGRSYAGSGSEFAPWKPFSVRTILPSPETATSLPTGVTAKGATLAGSVNPNGFPAKYHFEYGLTTSYGSSAPAVDASAGEGSEAKAVSEEITSLEPGTTYHYRLVSTNLEGTFYGEDVAFSTLGVSTAYQSSFGASGTGDGQFGASPSGIAVGPAGETWVVDRGNNRIQKFNSSGAYVSKFGSAGNGNGQFSTVTDIARDSSGNLWVTDAGNGRVQKFNEAGEYVSQFGTKGSGNGQFSLPSALAIDASGNIYVIDTGNDRVQKFNSSGAYVSKFGSSGSGNGQFSLAMGIDVGLGGSIWVSDYEANRVQKFNEAGEFVKAVGAKGTANGQFEGPRGIEVDGKGVVWVIDQGSNRVEAFNETGDYLGKFGSAGSGPGQFGINAWAGIASDSNGNIWVADSNNTRVQRWFVAQ